MLEKLFSSRVRTKLLVTFFMSPGIGYNARELALHLGENYSAVWKELVRLEGIGILTSEPRGNSKVYLVNPHCPIEPELRSMILKTEGIGSFIRSGLLNIEKIKAAFVYGSYASGEADAQSDLDLMIIGAIDLSKFAPVIAELEKDLRRSINYTVFSEEEWKSRRQSDDPFAANVVLAPKVILIGDEYAL
jgi:predicted nucleotidyltransferase